MAASLVDYLDSHSYDSSKESRRHLWQTFRPGEPYEFTSEQNTALLHSLQLDDDAPRLELTKQVFRVGESVTVKVVSATTVLIESDSAAGSMNASGGQEVSLGEARPGVYARRVVNALGSRNVSLLLFPMAGGAELSAVVLDAPTQRGAAAPPPSASDTEAVNTYVAAVRANPAILVNAARKKLNAIYVAEHVTDWQGPGTMCLIALLPNLSAKAECAMAAGGAVGGIAFDIFAQSIDEAGLTAAEAEGVRRLLVEPIRNLSMGTSLKAIITAKDAAGVIENGTKVVTKYSETIEAKSKSGEDLKLIVSVIIGFVGTVALLLQIKP